MICIAILLSIVALAIAIPIANARAARRFRAPVDRAAIARALDGRP